MIDKIHSFINRPTNKRIIENIFSLGALKFVAMLLPLIIIPHLIKTVGMASIGLLALATSISQYFGTLMEYGFAYTGAREVASNQFDKEKNTRSFFIIFYCKLFLLIISFLILITIALINDFTRQNFILILLSLVYVSLISLSPSWFFQGVQDMKKIALGEVTGKIISFILIISLIQSKKDLLLIPTFYIVGQIFSLFIYLIFLKKYIFLKPPSFQLCTILEKLKESWSMFVYILFPNFYNNYTYIALGYFSTLPTIAAYDIVRKVMNVSEQAISIISKVFYPVLIDDIKYFRSFLKVIGSIAVILCFTQLLTIHFGYEFLISHGISIEKNLLLLQSITPLVFAAWMAYGINNLGVQGKDRVIRNITIYISILGMLLVTVLTYQYEAFGALLGVLLTISIKAFLFYRETRKIKT